MLETIFVLGALEASLWALGIGSTGVLIGWLSTNSHHAQERKKLAEQLAETRETLLREALRIRNLDRKAYDEAWEGVDNFRAQMFNLDLKALEEGTKTGPLSKNDTQGLIYNIKYTSDIEKLVLKMKYNQELRQILEHSQLGDGVVPANAPAHIRGKIEQLNTQYNAKTQQLQQNLEQLESTVAELRQENTELKATITNHDQQIEEKNRAISELERENIRLEGLIEGQNNVIEACGLQIRGLQSQIQTLEQENTELKQQVVVLTTYNSRSLQQMERMEQQMNQMQASLSRLESNKYNSATTTEEVHHYDPQVGNNVRNSLILRSLQEGEFADLLTHVEHHPLDDDITKKIFSFLRALDGTEASGYAEQLNIELQKKGVTIRNAEDKGWMLVETPNVIGNILQEKAKPNDSNSSSIPYTAKSVSSEYSLSR